MFVSCGDCRSLKWVEQLLDNREMFGTKATLRVSQQVCILTLIYLMGTLSCLTAQTFQARTIEVEDQLFTYRVYVPSDWSADRQWPVILFLHGAGERGEDGIEQTTVGLGPQILQNPSRFPAIVVMPQCRTGVFWNDPLMEKLALESLQKATKEFNGDPRRTYLTGLSMGGYGTFALAQKFPDRFAAYVPVCGGVVWRGQTTHGNAGGDPYAQAAHRIGKSPFWIFHGDQDPRVPVVESRRMAAALREIGAEVRYTEYEGVGHNSWDKAYAEPELINWMLSKSLR